ncbi:MAG: hypothetical protein Q4F21_15060 [Lachnospiraceae bacterium]|nr:hypothetical protein [Lachnospiraceae bacterium]
MFSKKTELLLVKDCFGLESSIAGYVNFADLKQNVREEISSYYENQGSLYSIESELEWAYAEYQKCQKSGAEYQSSYIEPSVTMCASNAKILCFDMSVLSSRMQNAKEYHQGAVFDRETGKTVSIWDLFSVSKEEAVEALLSSVSEENLKNEMRQAIKPEYIILSGDEVNVIFPEGVLDSQEYSFVIGIEYEDLQGVLHDWANPDKLTDTAKTAYSINELQTMHYSTNRTNEKELTNI